MRVDRKVNHYVPLSRTQAFFALDEDDRRLLEIDHSDGLPHLLAQATPVEIRTTCMNFEE